MILTIDIGGTEIKYSIFEKNYKYTVFEYRTTTILKNKNRFIELLFDSINKIKSLHRLNGIAISCPGIITDGYVKNGGSIRSLDQLPLEDILVKKYKIPIIIRNDAQCALKAETALGALSDCNDGVVITLGTGVGGGIWLNKHFLASTQHTMAGEFSYMIHTFQPDGSFDRVGKKLSAIKMIRKINQHYKEKNLLDSRLAFKHIYDYEDDFGYQCFHKYCRAVSSLIINIQSVLDVSNFIIGGGISADSRVVTTINQEFNKIMSEDIMYRTFHVPVIKVTHFQNYSGRVGAQLFWQTLKEG